MARTGRPRKKIDKTQFEKLCGLQCTLAEIAGFFDCSEDTVERWALREYKSNFADCFKKYSAPGKVSLRRSQFRLAERNAAMAIWLGKQYLGQKDNVELAGVTITDETRKAIAGLLDAVDKGIGNNSTNEDTL